MQVIKYYFVVSVCVFLTNYSFADYKDPIKKTNVNKQTDLFEKSVDNWQGTMQIIEADKSDTSRFENTNNGRPEGLQYFSDDITNNIDRTKSELSRIKANDLEDLGRSKLLEENLEETIFVDESSPLYKEHQEDAELIASGTDGLMHSLLGKLKDNFDIDCRAEKGNKIEEPQYYMDITKEKVKNTSYNKTICEELKNTYSCQDTLKLICDQAITKPSTLSIVGANLPLIANREGYAQFGSGNPHWLSGDLGTQYDYYVSFNVINPENIQHFRLGSINYDDFVLITLNDNYIWSGPKGGQVLEFAQIPTFGYRMVITDHTGTMHSAENNTWFHESFNINLKPYLTSGTNILKIRLIVAGHGGLLFDLNMAERECKNWSETWDETGKLN